MSITDQHAATRAAERSTAIRRDHRVPLLGGRATGVYRRSAPWWPGGHRVATGELRAVVDRFEPQWQPRWLALYSLWLLPAAAVVLGVGSAV